MKQFYIFLFVIFSFSTIDAQIINFPDANFKAKLLEADTSNDIAKNASGNSVIIDTNSDGEIQTSEALLIYELEVSDSEIASLVGITSFVNLKNLESGDNLLTDIDLQGMINLEEVRLYQNLLTSANFSGLTNLTVLVVSKNQLQTLQINDLINLTQLTITFNNLTTLDISNLTQLQYFYAQHNGLESISLPNSSTFKVLFIYKNNLQSIDVTNLPNLESLQCYENELQSLDVSNNTSLLRLFCYDNQIDALNLDGLSLLEEVTAQNNSIDTFSAQGCTSLKELNLNVNSIDFLDLNDCWSLENLSATDNGLKILLLKIGSFWDTVALNRNSTLEYVCVDDFKLNSMLNVLAGANINNAEVNTYCTFAPGGGYLTITGNAKYDYDANGCDENDLNASFLKFNITNLGYGAGFTANTAGDYLKYLSEGSYTYFPNLENPSYFNVSPTEVSVNFPADPSPFEQDFCITPNGNHSDLEVELIPMGVARPGFDVQYKLIYKNKGTQTHSGQVTFKYDELLTDFIISNPIPSNQIDDMLYYDYSDLKPFEHREIFIAIHINSPIDTPPVNIGDNLGFGAVIYPVADDETPSDNSFDLKQVVVGSLDPNDKTCLQGESVGPETAGEYVHYLIRFENTGNYPAENIVVKDSIDTDKFDVSTLRALNSSHDFYTRVKENVVEFIFENINLPFDDANNDGYILFKIKTKPELQLGDTFSNEAAIYFDYNFPVITNEYITTIEEQLGIQDFEFNNEFVLYPNPSKNLLNFQKKGTAEITSVEIYNLLGQVVIAIPSKVESIDVSSLKVGSYFVKINTNLGSAFSKFIKE